MSTSMPMSPLQCRKELAVGRGAAGGAQGGSGAVSPYTELFCKTPRSQRHLNWKLVFQDIMKVYLSRWEVRTYFIFLFYLV